MQRPPALTETSVRWVSGNGWRGYIMRDPDPNPGTESVVVTLTRDDCCLLLTVSWPVKSISGRSECDALIRGVVWSPFEKTAGHG